MKHECYSCHTKTVESLITKFKPKPVVANNLVLTINKLLDDNRNLANPYLATEIHRIAKEKLNTADLYYKEKNEANNLLLNLYSEWQDIVNSSDNPFFIAAKLAVVGNIIDYGAHVVETDIVSQIKTLLKNNLAIDKRKELFDRIKKAKSILYLGDNNGEIVFDKLFLETIKHTNVTFAVRGKPIINDVTINDAKKIGIDKICKLISNGYDAPSTLLEHCSEEFIQTFNSADLIISKGMGNFEGLMNIKKDNIFFMLMAKCEPMAELLGVKKGDLIVGTS